MNEIMLTITGTQSTDDESEKIELKVSGLLSIKENCYTITYTEKQEDGSSSDTSIIANENRVIVSRSGSENNEMIFDHNKTFTSVYHTPFGNLDLCILTTLIKTDLKETEGSIVLEYIMNISGLQTVNRLNVTYKS